MNSKLTPNYKQKYSKQERHKALILFQRELIKNIEDQLNVYEIESKRFEVRPSSSDTYQTLMSRSVTFSTATDDVIYSLVNNHSYWFRNQLVELEVANTNGIFSVLDYVQRDTIVDNHSSLRKKVLHIEFNYEGKNLQDFEREVVEKVVKSIINASKELRKEIKGFKTPLGKLPKWFTMGDTRVQKGQSMRDVVSDITSKDGFAIFDDINGSEKRRLYSIDESVNTILTYYSSLEKETHALIRAGIRKSYKEVIEALDSKSLDVNDEMHFAKNELSKDAKDGIYVSIDIYRVITALLGLAHISEIQPDEWDSQTEDYIKRHLINKL